MIANIIYDQIIIGSGLCAFSYALGASTSNNLSNNCLCISSESLVSSGKKYLHPKLYVEQNQIIETINNKRYGVTSCIGGLSNAWGGVLVYSPKTIRMNINHDISDQDLLSAANSILNELTKKFNIHGYEIKDEEELFLNRTLLDDDIFVLYAKTKYGWESSGVNITDPLIELLKINNILFVKSKVNSLDFDSQLKQWTVKLTSGVSYHAKKIVLAGGALGNIALIENFMSCDLDIRDHTPIKAYGLQLPFFRKEIDSNHKTPIASVKFQSSSLVSLYLMSSLSDSFYSKFLYKYNSFRWIYRFALNRLLFGQYWSPVLTKSLKYGRGDQQSIKINLIQFIKSFLVLLKNGMLPLYLSITPKGEGFHYCCRRVEVDPSESESISDYLDEKFNGSLVVLGGIAFPHIPMEHPTFSFMIRSYLNGQGKDIL